MIPILSLIALMAPLWAEVGDALRSADAVAVRASDPPGGWLVAVGRLPAAPPADAPEGVLLVLAGGRLSLPARRAVSVRRGEARAVARFIEGWRARDPNAVLPALQWTSHPSRVVRAVAFGTLARAIEAGQALPEEAVEALIRLLTEPGVDDADRRDAVDVLARSRDPRVGDALAERFDQIASDAVRATAAGVLGRLPTPTTRVALRRCAQRDRALVKRRCARLLERVGHGAP